MSARAWGFVLTWGLQAAVGAALCFVPLFDVLSYEFCWTMGLVTAMTAPFVGLSAAERAARPAQALSHALGAGLMHVLMPLCFICLNGLRVQNCNWPQGLWFWAFLPGCTAVYGAALGLAVGRFGLHMGHGVRRMLVVGLILVPFCQSLYTLYTEPPITVFDHLWGYFAGSLYDEQIHIDMRLTSFRLGTLLRAVGLGAAVFAWERWPRLGTPTVMTTLCLALGVPLAYGRIVGPMMGYDVDRAAILAHLPVTVTRPHLVIHLPENTSKAMQARVADDHAFRLAQLTARLDITETRTLHSFVYPSADDKAAWMGGRHTMVAKPWLGEIHIHGVGAPHAMMPHELGHAIAASFGSPWLNISAAYELWVHMGLVEGVAEALSPDLDTLDLHHWAHALMVLKLAPDMRQILGPDGFWRQAPRRAYTVAGSFVRYLLDIKGPGSLKLAYPRADFEAAYGVPLDGLVREWEGYITSLATSTQDNHVAADRFDTPSIFTRTCAHEIARLEQMASEAAPERAVALRSLIATHLGGAADARARLALARRDAGDLPGFLQDADALLAAQSLSFAAQARLEEAASIALWESGHSEAAALRAQHILTLDVGDAQSRLAWVRLWALGQPEADQKVLMALTQGELSPVRAAVYLSQACQAHPDEPTFCYLLGRQLAQAEAWAEAVAPLRLARQHPFARIAEEAYRLLATSQGYLGDFEQAHASWQHLADTSTRSGVVAQARDGISRLKWQRAQDSALPALDSGPRY